MRQYLRKVRLTLNGLVINPGESTMRQLRIGFDVGKSLSSTPNDARIDIWNLSEGHRNAVGKELTDVMLEAGYAPPEGGGNVGVIFKGQIRDVEHKREGPDIVTTISCGDGDRAFRRATISKTFREGTPVKDVVEEIYKELEAEGVDRGEWKFPDDVPDYKRPYSMCGNCNRELDRLGRAHKFYWSIQNGTMEVVPGNGYIGGVVLLTPQSGLIDTPTITDNGVKVKALLNPEIRPGRRIQVKSETLEMNAQDDTFRVSAVVYRGDNYEGDFAVDITGEAVKDGKVDEGERR